MEAIAVLLHTQKVWVIEHEAAQKNHVYYGEEERLVLPVDIPFRRGEMNHVNS